MRLRDLVMRAGDTMSRLLEYCGASVTRVSHVGDLGLPVALVMAAMEHTDTLAAAGAPTHHVLSGEYDVDTLPSADQLSQLYLFSKRLTEGNPPADVDGAFVTAFRARVADLLLDIQKGVDARPATRRLWTRLVTASQCGYNTLFRRLNVTVEERGESTYVQDLPGTVKSLIDKGVAVQSDGAWVVPIAPTGAHALPPIVIQKTDGG